MTTLKQIAPLDLSIEGEPEIEATAVSLLKDLGYEVKFRKSGLKHIDKSWPSKSPGATGTAPSKPGFPDLLLCIRGSEKPVCVWENKSRSESVSGALQEAQFYIKGLHAGLPGEPSLPRLAAGFNGSELLLSYLNNEGAWIPLKATGNIIKDSFPVAEWLRNGISSEGVLTSLVGAATAKELRAVLWDLKTLYRIIPPLAPGGRRPIDFTIALLTVRLMVEQHPDWGTWAEQPALQLGAPDREQRVAERFGALTDRILSNPDLKERYGNILEFKEKDGSNEVSFDFKATLREIPRDKHHFYELFKIIDSLPPLLHADFDIFGEVYQSIGDEATKKALGEFFTGRHIISGVMPVFFHRTGWDSSFESILQKKIADIACGTGGFLTETLRLVRKIHAPAQDDLKNFALQSFYGFDLGHSNASRARVNMYFAGDGFSEVKGGVDSLDSRFIKNCVPAGGFDAVLTNPPYGRSSYGRSEEAFLKRVMETLKPGGGWGLIVLPTGILENPRSQKARFNLLKYARVTDIIALPKHAFAPYTQQRTAIIIFNKRNIPLSVADNDWDALLKIIGYEQVSMYIVDHDGYANSDKRYPTDRKDSQGKWLHNDLQDWLDQNGLSQPGDIYNALVRQIPPPNGFNEFDVPLGRKYAVFRIRDLFQQESGVILLPDKFLRENDKALDLQTYLDRGQKILDFKAGINGLTRPLAEELEEILSLPLIYGSGTPIINCKLSCLFDIKKGDHGLTEEVIYHYFDLQGMPVYGGGASGIRFKITRDAKTIHNKQVTIFGGPAIIISMDGTSGSMRVIDSGEFCLNHHGCVLTPFDISINLHWFVQQNEAFLKSLASNREGSATLTMEKLKEFVVGVPIPREIREKVGSLRKELVELQSQLLPINSLLS
jgi:type I restriction enzyme M protein